MGGDTLQFPHDLSTLRAKQFITTAILISLRLIVTGAFKKL